MHFFPVPIEAPRNTRYDQLGIAVDATSEEVRAAENRASTRLRAEGASEEVLAKAHAVDLGKPSARAAYDAENPPLALFRIEPTWAPMFDDRGLALDAVRRDVEAFLRERGVPPRPLSDLERVDFTAEYTFCPLLDEQARRDPEGNHDE